MEQIIPDLWDYVREHCMSLNSGEHYNAIADWVLDDVGSLYRSEVESINATLSKEKARVKRLKETLKQERALVRDLRRELREAK